MRVYVLHAYQGQWSDASNWIAGIYSSKEAGEDAKNKADNLIEKYIAERGDNIDYCVDKWIKKYRKLFPSISEDDYITLYDDCIHTLCEYELQD